MTEEPWKGQTLYFLREQATTEDRLRKVDWITIRKEDGSEEHWPVKADEVTTNSDGTVSVKFKALTADEDESA